MNRLIILAALALTLASCNNNPDYDATGIFEATTVTVSAETSGKILSMGADEGDSILAGQNIAVIDTALLVLQQLSARQPAVVDREFVARHRRPGSRIAHADRASAS